MLAEIITIGREILTGRTLDTNSNWLAKELTDLGIKVKRIVVVDDVVEEISKEILNAIKYGVRLIITTGGLGPTFDDKTMEGVSLATGRKLVLNRTALKMVEEKYKKLYEEGAVDTPELTEERKKMAYLPDGAQPIPNPVGAAPGMMITVSGCTIVSLPGVPKEMKEMFSSYVKPVIRQIVEREGKRRILLEKIIPSGSKDESLVAAVVKKVREKYPEVYIKSLPERFGKEVNIQVRFTAEGDSKEEVEALINAAIEEFKRLMKEDGDLTNGKEYTN
ncbi:MAG: competence/damage-inducible protein A [Deferribacteres bacterium]|nr:competence/damage-inducible protein A [Deferribacteres bacterium]